METGSNFDRHQHQQEAHTYRIEQKKSGLLLRTYGNVEGFFFFFRGTDAAACVLSIILVSVVASYFYRKEEARLGAPFPPQEPRILQVLLLLPPRLRSPFPSPSNTDPASHHTFPRGKKRDKKCRFLFLRQ